MLSFTTTLKIVEWIYVCKTDSLEKISFSINKLIERSCDISFERHREVYKAILFIPIFSIFKQNSDKISGETI